MSSRAILNGWPIGTGNPFPVGIKPPPLFAGIPFISPTSGDTATTYTAIDPIIANGTIVARAWLLGGLVIGNANTIVPGIGNDGQLVRRVTAVGDDGTTIVSLSLPVTVNVAAPALTQDNTLAGSTVAMASDPAWKARFQALEARFTALGVA